MRWISAFCGCWKALKCLAVQLLTKGGRTRCQREPASTRLVLPPQCPGVTLKIIAQNLRCKTGARKQDLGHLKPKEICLGSEGSEVPGAVP